VTNRHLLVESETIQNSFIWTKFEIFSPRNKLQFYAKRRLAGFQLQWRKYYDKDVQSTVET